MKNILMVLIIILSMTGCFSETNNEIPALEKKLEVTQKKLNAIQEELDKHDIIYTNKFPKDSIFLTAKKIYYDVNKAFGDVQLDKAKLRFDSIHILKGSNIIPKSLPVEKIVKSNIIGFGTRIHPISKVNKFHKGIDIPTNKGNFVKSTISGTVRITADKKSGYGKHIVIESEKGVGILLAQLDSILVKTGEKITKNQIVGKVGNTGTSIAPHLHYEIRIKGELINPFFAIYDLLNPEERKIINSNNMQSMD